MVAAQRDYRVDWRFISQRILIANVDYASCFPEHYEDEHTSGLRLLRYSRGCAQSTEGTRSDRSTKRSARACLI
jgi:hypothetical protein